jgi:TPR repeat protein
MDRTWFGGGGRLRRTAAAALVAGFCAAAAGAAAAPADDHQRGLTAYRRGDVVAAMAALRPAAQAGHAPSQSLLAFILERADFTEEAASFYRQAAAQNDADGHAGLATLYFTGRGIAKDEKAALQHFSKAAELGHAASIETLADAYRKGQLGLDAEGPDGPQAVAMWRRAAELRHAPSADALARGYRLGRHGLAADPAQADAWQARAAAIRQSLAAGPAASAASARAPK